ncbi:hypothetical protein SAMN05192540_0287 [Maribacter dokdonensis]|uniref:Uncharacterized protein n=1 Tax=Maribacter dokdonensis TaxID=320912 RepID=A0A1H4JCZ8_9FLAO|nr:hypothetical protein [Maribacter dokdonensis]SEB43997.1 hypothetical protein SAMN05192540_0287 [Maribacter dokdonensis]
MSSKIKFLLFFSFISFCATAQVKIGQNPNTIHSASIVELESTDKAFVLTRLSTAQMQAITPLNGAVVYNTDTQCVHYFNGTVWTNLCDGINTNDFSFTDNGDGTITLDDGNGNTITFNGAAQTISTLIDNGDGTYTYTNENGIETVISIAVTDNQNLQTDNTPGNISIDNGNALTINVDDADADAQNEIQTLDYTSGVLTLSNDPNATVVDLSAFDQNAADDFSGSFNDLNDLPVNLDTDATDDFNTAITFDGTNLTVSDAGGDVSTDISGLAYDDTALRADVDQNTADIDALETEQTTQNTNIATNATDIDNLEAEQTTQNNSIATNATDIDNLEAEQTTQNNSIATNASDISTNAAAIAAHNSADGDLSDSNEYNTGISFNGTDLIVTDLGGDQTVDISGLAYDDTALRTDVDQNTADIDALEAEQTTQNTNIATNVTDIDNLEAEQTTQNNSIGTNATDIDALEAEQTTQNNSITTNATDISTNAAAIAAHNSADGDLSDSNEYNTGISFDGTDLTVTDLGGDQTVNISGLAYDDTALRADVDQNTADIDALETEQTTQNTNIATNATDIDNLEAEQTTQNNSIATNATDIDNLEAEQTTQNNSIATNATDISTNAAAIAAHNSADGDLSDSNEYNTGISFDGTDLTVTDLGGDQSVDISGLAYDDTTLRADVDQNTADIDALETEQTTQNNSITTNATDISTNTAAIAAHNTADGDLSDSNEYNTGISFDGTDLTVTDLGGNQTVDISGLAYDDTALRADVDQNTSDIDALEAEQTTQNNSIATNATDIDNLEAEQTTQNNSIATNATDIDALEAEQTTQNNSIATNATDIDNLETEQTTQNNSIATNATDISTNAAAIAAHNTADGDLNDSNEYNTGISFNGTDLTVTDLGGDQTVDISGLAYDDSALRADVDQNTADIDALETEQTTQNNSIATNATDIDNLEAEQTTQNNSIATNTTDIDALEAEQTTQNNAIATSATDIDNLEAEQTTQNNSIATNATDIDNLEAEQTTQNNSIATNATDIDALEAEQTTQNNAIATNATDIDNLEAEQTTQNNSIATNVTDISTNTAAIAAHNTADGDLSDSNEYNTGISFDGTDLTVTDLGGDQTVDISGLAYDDTTLRADVDQNTADIDALETEQTTQNNAIATNASDIDNLEAEQTTQNNSIATNATDIDNLEAEQTTQNNSIATNATDIDNLEAEQTTQNNSIAANATDIDALEAEQTTQNNSIATNATDIDNLEAEQTTQNNSIATNATYISTNAAAIAAHNSADGDLSDSNEYNTGISFDGTDLTVTDLGGDQTVDISGLAYDDTALRADVDQNTADIDALETEQTTQNTNIATNTTDIDNLEAEQTSQNNSIATNATDIDALEAEQTTQNNSIATNATDISTNTAAIAAHNTADGDLSDSNEYNTGISFDGTDLTVTDGGGDQTVDISGLAYNDTALRADVDQNTADIDALETEQTTQNNSIATNATDIDNLEAEQTTQNNSIATNATDIDNLEAEQTTQNNSISSNSAAIATHNTADEDLSATNETNTSFSTVDVAGTDYLRISDSNGDLDVPLSDLSHTGTTGSVFFAGADGTPTENNGQLFWNSSSNSLGIGTSSPTNKLHVSGAIRSQGILNSNGTENEPAYRFNDDTNTGMFRPAADEIAFTVGGIEAMKIEETSSDTSVIINETLELEGAILDENDSPGTAGQVLTSTATGTEWVNSMSPIKAIGKISAAGGVTKATAGVTVSRISVGYYRVTLPTGVVSDADYIIQLTQPGRGGAGNDDPGISYSNQTATSFEVIIGDNDNGGTDRSRFDSEFMFTVLDL